MRDQSRLTLFFVFLAATMFNDAFSQHRRRVRPGSAHGGHRQRVGPSIHLQAERFLYSDGNLEVFALPKRRVMFEEIEFSYQSPRTRGLQFGVVQAASCAFSLRPRGRQRGAPVVSVGRDVFSAVGVSDIAENALTLACQKARQRCEASLQRTLRSSRSRSARMSPFVCIPER